MKKLLPVILAMSLICALAACGQSSQPAAPSQAVSSVSGSVSSEASAPAESEPTAQQTSSEVEPPQAEEMSPEANRISITIGDRTISAELDGSAIAKEFAGLLPQTISMQRVGGGREFYGTIGGSLHYDEADAQTTFENGELAYWFSGNGLCLLYDNQVADPEITSGVIIFGKMTSDFSFLRELDDRIEVTVALAE